MVFHIDDDKSKIPVRSQLLSDETIDEQFSRQLQFQQIIQLKLKFIQMIRERNCLLVLSSLAFKSWKLI